MPLGNGDTALNLWVEQGSGDVLMLIGKGDAWDQNSINCKLGRVRLKLQDHPFDKGTPFRQELRLATGDVLITRGSGENAVKILVWVDANQPVIRMQVDSQKPLLSTVSLETWRNEKRALGEVRENPTTKKRLTYGTETSDLFKNRLDVDPYPTIITPDTILPGKTGQITWLHNNTLQDPDPYEVNMKLQGMGDFMAKSQHPLKDRIFGASLQADGWTSIDSKTLQSKTPQSHYQISIYPLTMHPATLDQWNTRLSQQIAHVNAVLNEKAREDHEKWWSAFWERSRIQITQPAGIPVEYPLTANVLPLKIGDDKTRDSFRGQVAGVAIYDRVLKMEEVAGLCEEKKNPSAIPGHVVSWDFKTEENLLFPSCDGSLNFKPSKTGKVVDGPSEAIGKAVQLGENKRLIADYSPRLNGLRSLSISTWVKPDEEPAMNKAPKPTWLIKKSQERSDTGFELQVISGNGVRWTGRGKGVSYGAKLPASQWSHIVVTYDAKDGDKTIYLNGKLVKSSPVQIDQFVATPEKISQTYQLCRFMNACAGRSEQPIKFNGSLFSVGTPENPDYRRWGGPGFWFQNERLVYWPMLAAGDLDLMEPWFRMYREALPFATARVKKYFDHAGALFGETIYFWGAEASSHYEWMPFESRTTPLPLCSYLTYYFSNNLESIAMMFDYYEQSGDLEFLKATLIPHALEVMRFFDLHYTRDTAGKLSMYPAQALETYQKDVTNALPEIAGLRYTLPRLLALPEGTVSVEELSRWKRLLTEVPAIPLGEVNGARVILPAERYRKSTSNVENPELYAVFPYRIFGLNKPDLEIARATFANRIFMMPYCWHQDDVQAALLGLSDEAARMVAGRASPSFYGTEQPNEGSRFPAFFKPNHDWVPDVDHGGNLQLALQYMLVQNEGKKIHLFPAWPKDWNVKFKLHCPFQTTVEGSLQNGKLENLIVTPASRQADVVLDNGLTVPN